MEPLNQFNQSAQKVIESLKEDLKSIRTGRATPALVENLMVLTYGGSATLKLMELATITTEGPAALSVSPFDPSVLSDIEKAILKSPLGISPAVQGNRIILRIPQMTSEQRDKFVKLVAQKIEERRGILRNLRDSARKSIKISYENKDISEDVKFRQEKEIDLASQKFMDEVQSIKERKEQEIREV